MSDPLSCATAPLPGTALASPIDISPGGSPQWLVNDRPTTPQGGPSPDLSEASPLKYHMGMQYYLGAVPLDQAPEGWTARLKCFTKYLVIRWLKLVDQVLTTFEEQKASHYVDAQELRSGGKMLWEQWLGFFPVETLSASLLAECPIFAFRFKDQRARIKSPEGSSKETRQLMAKFRLEADGIKYEVKRARAITKEASHDGLYIYLPTNTPIAFDLYGFLSKTYPGITFDMPSPPHKTFCSYEQVPLKIKDALERIGDIFVVRRTYTWEKKYGGAGKAELGPVPLRIDGCPVVIAPHQSAHIKLHTRPDPLENEPIDPTAPLPVATYERIFSYFGDAVCTFLLISGHLLVMFPDDIDMEAVNYGAPDTFGGLDLILLPTTALKYTTCETAKESTPLATFQPGTSIEWRGPQFISYSDAAKANRNIVREVVRSSCGLVVRIQDNDYLTCTTHGFSIPTLMAAQPSGILSALSGTRRSRPYVVGDAAYIPGGGKIGNIVKFYDTAPTTAYQQSYEYDLALIQPAPPSSYARNIRFTDQQPLAIFNQVLRLLTPSPPPGLHSETMRDIWAVTVGQGAMRSLGQKGDNYFRRCHLWRHTGYQLSLVGFSGCALEVVGDPDNLPPVAEVLGFQNFEINARCWDDRVACDDEDGTVQAMRTARHPIYASMHLPTEVHCAEIRDSVDPSIPL